MKVFSDIDITLSDGLNKRNGFMKIICNSITFLSKERNEYDYYSN